MSDTSPEILQPTPGAPKRRRPIWVRILKWTLVSLAIVVGTPIALALLVLLLFYFASGPSDSTKPVRFTFLDRGFAIPKNYQPCCRLQEYPSIVWIDALLPDFAPYSKARRDEWFAVGTGSPSVNIEFHSSSRMMRPDDRLRMELEDAIDPNGQPGPAGLRRYDMRDDSISVYEIVYVPEESGDVIYVGCHIYEGRMTGCSMHVIYDAAAAFDVGFDSHFLADWREIAAGTRRLLKSFQTY